MVKRLPSRVLSGSQVELSILPLVGQYLAPDGTLFPIATLLDAEKILTSGPPGEDLLSLGPLSTSKDS